LLKHNVTKHVLQALAEAVVHHEAHVMRARVILVDRLPRGHGVRMLKQHPAANKVTQSDDASEKVRWDSDRGWVGGKAGPK